MSPELVIDGYNLLHYAGMGGLCHRPGKFEQARDQLLLRLKRSLSERELSRTLVVFDAQHAEHADRRPVIVHGMTVVFSPRGRQADDLIEDLLCATRQPRLLRVVSSDHRLLRAARAVGANFIDSDSFLVELDERKASNSRQGTDEPQPELPNRIKSPVELSADDWMVEFGDIDPDEIEKSLRDDLLKRPSPSPVIKNPAPPSPVKPQEPRLTAPSGNQRSVTPIPKGVPPVSVTRPVTPKAASPGDSQIDAEQTVLEDELAFWEQRISDLAIEDSPANGPGKPTTGRRQPPGKPPRKA